MWKLSYKIYASANAAVAVIALLFIFLSPVVFVWAVLISLFSSLPSIPALYSVFQFIEERRPPVLVAWIILLTAVLLISLLPLLLVSMFISEAILGETFFYLLSMAAGFAGVVLCSASIHQFFLKTKYSRYEND